MRTLRAGRGELVHQLVGDLVVGGAPLALHLLAHLHAEVAQALAALPPAAAAQAAAVARARAAPARRAPAAGSLVLVGKLCFTACPHSGFCCNACCC